MVSLLAIQQSNALVANLPSGLVALFIGATSGIGQSALQHFAKHASSPRIYSVARPATATSHSGLLDDLRQSHPGGTYGLIEADVSLISEVDKVVRIIKRQETKLDLVFVSTGFMPFEGRSNTSEGLDPSMTTRYYSRLRAVQQLLPLLNNPAARSPRIVSVLAGGLEGPIKEDDLDLRDPENWSTWGSSVQSATMGTLALEVLAQENPGLSIVHWFPGRVATPGLARSQKFGMSVPPDVTTQDEAGERALFLATSDRYGIPREGMGGLVPMSEGLGAATKSGGGIFLVDPQGESADSERVMADFRQRGVDKSVWSFTQKVFADAARQGGSLKDEL